MSALVATISTTALIAVLTGYAHIQSAGWASRGITTHLGWPATFVLQAIAASAVSFYTYQAWGTGPSIAVAGFVWLGTLAISTDIKSGLFPWDISHPVAWIGLVVFGFNYSLEGLLSLGTGIIGLVGIPLVASLLTRRNGNHGLGDSDIRLLWAATASLSWWVGQNWLLYAVLLACLIEAVNHVAARVFGYGTRETITDTNAPDTNADTDVTESTTTTVELKTTTRPRKPRLFLPFAPALVLSILGFTLWATHTGYGACLMWNPTGTC